MQPFVWGDGGEQLTPEDVARRRLIAQAMIQRSTDTSPIQHWTQGAARVAQAIAGMMQDKFASDDLKAGRDSAATDFSKLAIGSASPTPALGSTFAPATDSGGTPAYRDAIARIESGGRYDALGPQTDSGDRAYGKYQVMGQNVGPWTEAHLGQRLTPQQFLANPQAQDAVFDGQFGSYVKQFGPQGAAQAWFGGPGAVGQTGRKDMLGTSVGDYGEKFMAGLGGASAPSAGVQRVAQAMTAAPNTEAAMKVMNNPWASPGQRAVAQAILTRGLADPNEAKLRELQVRQAEQSLANAPLETESKRLGLLKGRAELGNMPIETEGKQLANEKARRDLLGEGATPLTEAERQAIGIPRGQAAYKTRTGEIKFGPAGTVVRNEGQIPPGYRATRDPEGNVLTVEPIPGSKPAEAAIMRDQADQARAGTVTDAIGRIEKQQAGATLPTTGFFGSALTGVPGTAAHDISELVSTIRSNIGLEQLNSLRQQSPTGGALGAVTNAEHKLLQDSVAALSQSQSQGQFQENLDRVKAIYNRVIHGGAPSQQAPGAPQGNARTWNPATGDFDQPKPVGPRVRQWNPATGNFEDVR